MSVWRPRIEIGRIIREIRERLGMTQRDLAEHLGSPGSQSQVSLWERGRHRPAPDTLRQIAGLADEDLSVFQRPAGDLDRPGEVESSSDLFAGEKPVSLEYFDAPQLAGAPERLLGMLVRRAGLSRVARALLTDNLVGAAYSIALEDRWDRDELRRLDRLRDLFMREAPRAPGRARRSAEAGRQPHPEKKHN
jgi:transcriptional regulator with XRE-family HTH domain